MDLLIIAAFLLGYSAIAFESVLRISKSAIALITGVVCWTLLIIPAGSKDAVVPALTHHISDISQILFFLLGAMTIVELIDAHDGFEIITKRIQTRNRVKLMWIISLMSFFLSAVLDNLTTSIVMVSLLRKLMDSKQERWLYAGAVVMACNAGGAWSPIGDVTTTMLWMGGQITALNIILQLFIPSFICMLVPLLFWNFTLKGDVTGPVPKNENPTKPTESHQKIIFFSGLFIFLLVPLFKSITHLPPFMGILLGLGILWIIVEILQRGRHEEELKKYSVAYVLRNIDTASILFFLGILMAVAALETSGQLMALAVAMDKGFAGINAIVLNIGLLSALVDNVPLVAATKGMYSMERYPTDHYFWEFLAYASGIGGSLLIIGSAAGIAVMGIEKINFFWYFKKISWMALAGYLSGAVVYMLMNR